MQMSYFYFCLLIFLYLSVCYAFWSVYLLWSCLLFVFSISEFFGLSQWLYTFVSVTISSAVLLFSFLKHFILLSVSDCQHFAQSLRMTVYHCVYVCLKMPHLSLFLSHCPIPSVCLFSVCPHVFLLSVILLGAISHAVSFSASVSFLHLSLGLCVFCLASASNIC